MFRFTFRLIGYLALVGAFIAIVVDGARSIAAGRLVYSALGDAWTYLAPRSLASVQAMLSPSLRDTALGTVLLAPTVPLLIVLAVVFLLLGRSRHRA